MFEEGQLCECLVLEISFPMVYISVVKALLKNIDIMLESVKSFWYQIQLLCIEIN